MTREKLPKSPGQTSAKCEHKFFHTWNHHPTKTYLSYLVFFLFFSFLLFKSFFKKLTTAVFTNSVSSDRKRQRPSKANHKLWQILSKTSQRPRNPHGECHVPEVQKQEKESWGCKLRKRLLLGGEGESGRGWWVRVSSHVLFIWGWLHRNVHFVKIRVVQLSYVPFSVYML